MNLKATTTMTNTPLSMVPNTTVSTTVTTTATHGTALTSTVLAHGKDHLACKASVVNLIIKYNLII